MRIVYLAAGAANMYCGSCLHDNTLAAGLLEAGHEVLLVPTYTPLRTDEVDVSVPHLFFGGINVYLQQKSALFRHTPWWLDAWLDRPGLISLATRLGPGVDPARLGDLTISMIHGELGRQRKELDKLVRWLAQDVKPEVVHLSNAMLIGMARAIRQLPVPVVCSLSGEDVFLERLAEPFRAQAREAMRERARDVDVFVALNRYYADTMADYLDVARERVAVIPHGLRLDGHGTRGGGRTGEHFTIGYLARICPDKGLHHLVAAVELLQADASLPPVRLRVAGYLGESDKPYLEELQARVRRWPAPERFEYVGEVSRDEKIAFLQSLDVMSVPTVYRESKGLSALEAMANAVPVVLPAHGAFPELIADTQGGLLFEPENPRALADRLKELIRDPAQADALGRNGKRAVAERYHMGAMARQTLQLYERVCGEFAAARREAEAAGQTDSRAGAPNARVHEA